MKLNKWEILRIGGSTKIPVSTSITIRLGELEEKMKKRIIKSLDRGFYMGYSGAGTDVYELICRTFDIPYCQVKRELGSRWFRYFKETIWRVRVFPDTKELPQALLDLKTADDMAVRMIEDENIKKEIAERRSWYGVQNFVSFFQIRDKKMLESAIEDRMAPHQAKILRAKLAIANGEEITFRQE